VVHTAGPNRAFRQPKKKKNKKKILAAAKMQSELNRIRAEKEGLAIPEEREDKPEALLSRLKSFWEDDGIEVGADAHTHTLVLTHEHHHNQHQQKVYQHYQHHSRSHGHHHRNRRGQRWTRSRCSSPRTHRSVSLKIIS
jgi:hypothetical protein